MTRRRRLLWVAGAVVVLVAVAIAIIAIRCPTMKLDDFLGPVKSQLMRPPSSSEAALVAAAEGRALPPRALPVSIEELGYGRRIGFQGVRTTFDAPQSALCVGFEQELGRYDIVRCRYRVHGWVLDLAMSAHVSAIRLSGSDLTGDPLAVAQQVERQLFEPELGVVLRIEGCEGERTFGSHDVEATGLAPPAEWAQFPHWRDTLAWWHEPGQVGFIAIHAYGVPTKIILPGADEEANRRWFSEDMPEWYFARDLERLVGSVQRQLMLPPLRLLNAAIRAAAGPPEELPDGVSVVPAKDTRYVPRAIPGLRSQFQVAPGALCFAFEQEVERIDVIRCGNGTMDYTATAQLMTISMDEHEGSEGAPLDRARLVAKTLFEPGLGLVLREVGRVAYFTIGELDVEAPAPASTTDGGVTAPWRATHTWWYRPGEVGFVMVKPSDEAAGQPPPEVTVQANKRWFSKDEPDWFRPRKR